MKHRHNRRPAARPRDPERRDLPPLPGPAGQPPRIEPRDDRVVAVTARWLIAALLALTAAVPSTAADGEPPSAALLEFLGELDPVDDETWLLLEQHALGDLARDDEVQNE